MQPEADRAVGRQVHRGFEPLAFARPAGIVVPCADCAVASAPFADLHDLVRGHELLSHPGLAGDAAVLGVVHVLGELVLCRLREAARLVEAFERERAGVGISGLVASSLFDLDVHFEPGLVRPGAAQHLPRVLAAVDRADGAGRFILPAQQRPVDLVLGLSASDRVATGDDRDVCTRAEALRPFASERGGIVVWSDEWDLALRMDVVDQRAAFVIEPTLGHGVELDKHAALQLHREHELLPAHFNGGVAEDDLSRSKGSDGTEIASHAIVRRQVVKVQGELVDRVSNQR